MIPVRVSLFLPYFVAHPRSVSTRRLVFAAARLSRNSDRPHRRPPSLPVQQQAFGSILPQPYVNRRRGDSGITPDLARVLCAFNVNGRAVLLRSPAQCRRCFAPSDQQQTFARIRPAPPGFDFPAFQPAIEKAENVRGFRLIRALIDRANLARGRSVGVAACNTYPPSRALHRGTVPARSIGHLCSVSPRETMFPFRCSFVSFLILAICC